MSKSSNRSGGADCRRCPFVRTVRTSKVCQASHLSVCHLRSAAGMIVEHLRCDVSRLCFGLEFVQQTRVYSGCCLICLLLVHGLWDWENVNSCQRAGVKQAPEGRCAGLSSHLEEPGRCASHGDLTIQRSIRSISLEPSCSVDYTSPSTRG